MVWHSPGFFSLTVPYELTRDFFYSGHTGSLCVIVLEMFYINYRIMFCIGFLCLIFMMNMLIITRVHYTIDVMAGLIFAFFYHKLASKFVKYIDMLFTIPFYIVGLIITKCKSSKVDDETDSTKIKKT